MKTIVRLLFSVVIFSHSYLIGMQLDPQLVGWLDRMEREHFSDMTKDSGEKDPFRAFAQDILITVDPSPHLREVIVSEPMCQHIVESLTNKLIEKKYATDNYAVAKKLAEHMPQYKTICEGIENAFNPDGEAIQNSWYANATKYVPVKYFARNQHHGHSGGVMTPLSYAIKTVNDTWCGKLIVAGADVNKKYPDVDGDLITALYEAIYLKEDTQGWGHDEIYHTIVKLLLTNNAQINMGCEFGGGTCVSPLDLAVSYKDKQSIFVLLIRGALSGKLVISERTAQALNEFLSSPQELAKS